MNKSRIILIASFLLAVYSCTKEGAIHFSDPNINPNPDTVYANLPAYDLTEDFEHGLKAAYNKPPDTATLATGIWTLTDAIIINSSGDAVIDNWSVRIENAGTVTTNFSISGLKMVYVSSATYGTDAASSYTLQASTDSGKTFTQVGDPVNVSATTMHTDSFTITASVPVRIRIAKSSSGGKRINIDNIVFKGIGSSGIHIDTTVAPGGNNYADTTPPRNIVVAAGDIVPPASGDNSNLLLGNPSGAGTSDAGNYLLNQQYYAESYSASQGKPNWTAWHLGKDDLGSSGRNDSFAAWASIPDGWYQVGPNDYSGSGFERGHNCPSADRTSSLDANQSTFLMTNMMPQASENNEKIWGNLEDYTRTQVKNGNEAYIYCGSYGQGGSADSKGTIVNKIDNGRVTVPAYTWKIVVLISYGNEDISRINANTRVIAVIMPNNNSVIDSISNSDWTKYIVTVSDIEAATGYNFFSTITDNTIKNTLKSKKDSGN